jgi:hypothetical protein
VMDVQAGRSTWQSLCMKSHQKAEGDRTRVSTLEHAQKSRAQLGNGMAEEDSLNHGLIQRPITAGLGPWEHGWASMLTKPASRIENPIGHLMIASVASYAATIERRARQT